MSSFGFLGGKDSKSNLFMVYGKSKTSLDPKLKEKLEDQDMPVSKKFKLLSSFTENGSRDDVRLFYSDNYSLVYNIFLDSMQYLDHKVKEKKSKHISTSDILKCCQIMLNLLLHARSIIQKKWQYRSIVRYLEYFVDPKVCFPIRKAGFELVLNFVDIMQDAVDTKVLDLIMGILDFTPFANENIKLPKVATRDIIEGERIKMEQAKDPASADEVLTFVQMFFMFIRTGEQLSYWWKFFKARLAPILYPHECQSLELLNKSDDTGFRQPYSCPADVHLLILTMLLESLETPKKSQVLYASDKDIYLMLLIFRQSFLLPPKYFEHTQKMLKTYRSWICKDFFLYQTPPIMERNQNIYFRLFIDNLTQVFFMKGEDAYLDVHLAMCYEALEIFFYFQNMPEKVDFDTWATLLIAHMEIYEDLIQRKSSNVKYDNELAKMLADTIMRNLYILWIHANPDETKYEGAVDLWEQFAELFKLNYKEECVAEFWRSTLINLTKEIIIKVFKLPADLLGEYIKYPGVKYLCTKRKGKITTTAKEWDIDISEFLGKQSEDFLLRLWHKFLWVYGDNSSCDAPSHIRKLKVICEIVEMLLSISHKEVKVPKGSVAAPFVHSPEGNKILDLFGEILFEACERDEKKFIDGRTCAYVTLCKIFSQKFSQPFEKKYLAQFYRVITLGLTSVQPKLVDTIILNSWKIFSYGHQGVNMLIPLYVRSAEKILTSSSDVAADDVKKAAINCISSIIALCYSYGDIKFPDLSIFRSIMIKIKRESENQKKPEQPTEKQNDSQEQQQGDQTPSGEGSSEQKTEQQPVQSKVSIDEYFQNNHPEDAIYLSYKAIRTKICQILMTAIDNRPQGDDCQIMCIWGLFVILIKQLEVENDSKLNGITIENIIDPILNRVLVESDAICLSAHDAFTTMAQLGMLSKLGDQINTKIINHLCTKIIEHLKEGKTIRIDIVNNLFYTLQEIIAYCPEPTVSKTSTINMIMDAISLGLSDDVEKRVGDAVKTAKEPISTAAKNLLSFMLNMVNNFPSPNGPSIISTNLTEWDYLPEQNGVITLNPKIHHFSFNNTHIITVMESPTTKGAARLIIRDVTGMYCWEFKLFYRPENATFKHIGNKVVPKKTLQDILEETENEDETTGDENSVGTEKDQKETSKSEESQDKKDKQATEEKSEPTTETKTDEVSVDDDANAVGKADSDSEEELDDYPKFDPEIDTDRTDMFFLLLHYAAKVFPEYDYFIESTVVPISEQNIEIKDLLDAAQQQKVSEIQLLQETPKRHFKIQVPPEKPDIEQTIYRAFKHFLNNMGLIRSNKHSLVRIEQNHKFFRTLKQLDKTCERETMKMGVIYVANGQEMQKDILKNDKGSALYSEFVDGLGWPVDLSTHTGFMGGLDQGLSTGTIAPYYANVTTELLFHVVTLMPTNEKDPQQIQKKRHVGNDFVHIIWSEHDRDYRPWTISSHCIFVHIIVYPLKSGLFRIQIFSKPDVPIVGPLLDGMIIDKSVLAPLVRMTAINAYKAVRYKQQGYKKPYSTRKDMIDDIVQKYVSNRNAKYLTFLQPLFQDQ